MPNELAKVKSMTLTDEAGNRLTAQLTAPGLIEECAKPNSGKTARQLHFILPALAKGKSLRLTGTLKTDEPKAGPSRSRGLANRASTPN